MFYITGDTHGEVGRFRDFLEKGEFFWDRDDYLMVCGDFGYVFRDTVDERRFLDELEGLRYTICFCDGNHENFRVLNQFPVEIWNGGRIHRVRKNIIHLMRGQVYTISGKKFFTMGGAYSIDRYTRKESESWWKEELPNNDEYREAIRSLKEHGNEVDYILTHTAPRLLIYQMGKTPDTHDAELTGFLEWVMTEVKFKKWFFGHWHIDREFGPKMRALWFDLAEIPSD